MEKTQLISLLQSLDPKEVREIRKFLRSPFFNHRKDVIKLFDYVIPLVHKNVASLGREKVYAKVYGTKESFNEQSFRQLLSWLQQLLEKYLAYQALSKEELEVKIRLAGVFQDRNLPKHFKKTIRDVEQKLSKLEIRNTNYHEWNFELEHQKYIASSVKRMTAHNFQVSSDHLDFAYILKKLRQVCLSVAHQTVYKTEYKLGLFEHVLDYIEKKQLEEHPTIAVYLYCYYTMTNVKRTDYFFKFKNILIESANRFSLEELRNLYLFAINFCIRRLNEGDLAFADEGLDLYKNALDSRVLFLKGVLSRFTFRNIVAMGLKVKEYVWVERFIERYQDNVEPGFQASNYALNMATLEYHRKNYDRIMTLLQFADYKDLLMNLSAKTLLAKVYYELDEDILLEAHLQTMQVFIKRKRIIGYHRKNYLNFIYYLKQLLKTPFSKAEKKQLLVEQVNQEEVLTERDWFLSMINR